MNPITEIVSIVGIDVVHNGIYMNGDPVDQRTHLRAVSHRGAQIEIEWTVEAMADTRAGDSYRVTIEKVVP